MPRVLILGEFPTLNGGERSLLAVLPTIQSAGWQVDAHVPAAGPFAERLQSFGIPIHGTPPSGTSLDERRTVLTQLMPSTKFDLLHANSLAMSRMSGPVAVAANVPSLAHLRDIVGLNKQVICDLNAHTRLLAVSQAVADFHIAQGLDREKVHVLHNGIDLNAFLPSPLVGEGPGVRGIRRELELPEDAQLIAIIGQVILRKGHDTALAAAVAVLFEFPQAHVLVVGVRHSEKPETVDYERRLREFVASNGMNERVHFLGTRTDVAHWLPQVDLLLHTPQQEPLGRVLLEAAACSVPVVATDVGGTREIFPAGIDDGAILVRVEGAFAAAAAMKRLLADRELSTRMGAAGRRRAQAAFSAERSAAGLLEQYRTVAASRS